MRNILTIAALAALTATGAVANEWTRCTITWGSSTVDDEPRTLVDTIEERNAYYKKHNKTAEMRNWSVFKKGNHLLFPSTKTPQAYELGEKSQRIELGYFVQTQYDLTGDQITRQSYLISFNDEDGTPKEITRYEHAGALTCEGE